MQITEVKVFPVQEQKLKAFVSIVFDSCFMVNDIKIIQGRDGLFISMPSRRKKNGRFKDVAHPLNNETRQMIEGQVLAEYDSIVSGQPRAEEPQAAAAERVAPPPPDEEAPAERPDPPPRPAAEEAAPAPPRSAESAAEAPPPEAESHAATPTTPEPAPAAEVEEDKSLEEVAEKHLRDSFWST